MLPHDIDPESRCRLPLPRREDLLAQLGEGGAVRRLGGVQEVEDAPHALRLQLRVDGVAGRGLGPPEGELGVGQRVT